MLYVPFGGRRAGEDSVFFQNPTLGGDVKHSLGIRLPPCQCWR